MGRLSTGREVVYEDRKVVEALDRRLSRGSRGLPRVRTEVLGSVMDRTRL